MSFAKEIPTQVPSSADLLFASSSPRSRHAHWVRNRKHGTLFLVNGSQIFDASAEELDRLDRAAAIGDEAVQARLEELGLNGPTLIDDNPPVSPPPLAVSLAIAQKCNLGCTYCYADEGRFGGSPRSMNLETARQAIDLMVQAAEPGDRVNLSFLGGEPLTNRTVLRAATEYAQREAALRGVRASYSITTNGTLLTKEDGDFFEHFGFAVTISMDGLRESHDRDRRFKNGAGTFDRIMQNVQPLLRMQRQMQVSVRATITPDNVRLLESLDFFFSQGFHSAGFSPLLRSPNGRGEMGRQDLALMLEAMVECGMAFERSVVAGQRFAFNNIVNAMRELHNGTHRPYPCGAGAGYLGVSAEGQLAACHRFVGDESGHMGTLASGIDRERQSQWLKERHVHRQEPCRSCWARYLCAGGCHHEVMGRGRIACDFIRGWLHYCLSAYDRLSRVKPDWFEGMTENSHA